MGELYASPLKAKLRLELSSKLQNHKLTAPLLHDILCGGVYGSNDYTRLHSSTVTLNAVKDISVSTKIQIRSPLFFLTALDSITRLHQKKAKSCDSAFFVSMIFPLVLRERFY